MLAMGLIGPMCVGTKSLLQHMHTTFKDCIHGSEMQCNANRETVWDVATAEGLMPQEFAGGADNTLHVARGMDGACIV